MAKKRLYYLTDDGIAKLQAMPVFKKLSSGNQNYLDEYLQTALSGMNRVDEKMLRCHLQKIASLIGPSEAKTIIIQIRKILTVQDLEGTNMRLSNAVSLNTHHFENLSSIRGDGCDWIAGRVPFDWATSVGFSSEIAQQLPQKKMNRIEMLDFCKRTPWDVSIPAILAWGGMKIGHGRRVSVPAVWEQLKPIANGLSAGNLCRRSAYDTLAQFRAQNSGCGLGPAYFTKLIYFLAPKHDGYIMDQWTSLSVNLLFSRSGKPIVNLITNSYRGRRTDTVSDKNLPEDYECFCLCVEKLAESLQIENASRAEEWIFSKGGRHPAPWRKYVLANRPSTR
jgi:hypothetical protein